MCWLNSTATHKVTYLVIRHGCLHKYSCNEQYKFSMIKRAPIHIIDRLFFKKH